MIEKIDKIQALLNVPNVDADTETAITNMKILNLLVGLRAEAEQLILSGVVGQSEQLKRDTFIKSREETARAREASAIKQTLEIYCSHDELPTVNEVLERIGRKH